MEELRPLPAQLRERGGADQHHQATEPDHEPDSFGGVQSLAGDEEVRQHHGGERHYPHENTGEAALDPLLTEADQPERDAIAGER